ncbi:hypothetical protein [Phytohabitans aurantiacus]|jgi:hypothetical protein|uniref:Uncharacterized protein n=1 Tax=Phytohabitans aurantiacus TaxID=3016789 RepID=A0ABQ5R828_9ACTN|nr:hypothetical protein [Phytohabitans aurantiacus]GLI02738.1 hypothetical protein Pa4123_80160 [Phytohabitans aurantiacus]
MTPEPARRAAWDAYLVVTVDLLPDLDGDHINYGRVSVDLTSLATRIRLWAPGWGPTGQVLAAAISTALRLHRDGHHNDLARLLRVIAARLFRVASRRSNPARGPAQSG